MPHLFGVGPYQILVVAAYCISRLGITSLLTKCGRDVTIVEATCFEGAFDKLAQEEFAAAFLYVAENPSHAVRHINLLQCSYPHLMLAVFSEVENASAALSFFAAGVRGYISLRSDQKETQNAINSILEGRAYFPQALIPLEAMHHDPAQLRQRRHTGLTDRQSAVLNLLLDGHSNKRIALALGLSPHTVKIHVGAVLRFFAVHRREELSEAALRIFTRIGSTHGAALNDATG